MTASRMAGRYNPDDPSLRYGVAVRHAALTSAASGVRVRRGRVPVEQVLLGAAAVLFPLGLVLVMLGWWGAAHTGHLYAQIDYLISGGLLGLGISVAGGFMYFGYWLSRQLGEARRQNALTLRSLQRIEDLLDAALPGGVGVAQPAPVPPPVPAPVPPPVPAPAPAPAPAPVRRRSRTAQGAAAPDAPFAGGADPTREVPSLEGPLLLATPRGSLLHRPDCPVVARRDDSRLVPAGSAGFGYCNMCDAAGVLR